MPLTFVDVVDSTLKRVGVLQTATTNLAQGTGTASELFVQSQNQHSVDLVLQIWQEAVQHIYSLGLGPSLVSTATVALVDGQREYDLPNNFERVAGNTPEERVLRGATTDLVLEEYPGGYLKMLADQPTASDWTGDPASWAISPASTATAIQIRIDREPTSDQDGDIYNMAYELTVELTSTMATDFLPFSDTVANAVTPVVAEMYNRHKKQEFDSEIFALSLSRALSMIRRVPNKARWGTRRGS